jgi:hypothetical protein
MGACRRIGAFVLLHFMVAVLPARANAEPERLRIQFSPPHKCGGASAFIQALRQRTARFQLAGSGERARLFSVTVTQVDATIAGRLKIQGPGNEVSVRSISGSNCDDVIAALALMTALAIDPGVMPPTVGLPSAASPSASPADTSPLGAPPPSASSSGTSKAPSSPAAPANPSNRTTTPVPEASPLPPQLAQRSEAISPGPGRRAVAPSEMDGVPREGGSLPEAVQVTSSRPASERWTWSVGAHGGTSLRVSPTPGLGGLLFVEAAPRVALPSLVFRAGLFLNQSEVSTSGGAGANFQWIAAVVEGCPIRLPTFDARIVLDLCLAFHIGVLRAQGRNLDQPAKATNLWADLGPVLRLRIAITTRAFLEAQGMLVLPLRHLTYDVHDAGPTAAPSTLFAVPSVGALAGIGLSYQLQ